MDRRGLLGIDKQKLMPKDTIHFAHANSFPAGTYSKLFSFLQDDFDIAYLERHAHNPEYPVTDGWVYLAQELKHEIERRHTQPVFGVGHSLGGILHFLVAAESPELYKGIILLDAPLLSPLRGAALRLVKRFKVLERFTPTRQARLRRNQWQNKEEAHTHFSEKEKFKRFDEDVLKDYIEHGLVKTDEGYQLAFKPEIEASIYRALPDSYASKKRKLIVPAAHIGGSESVEARLAGLNFMKKHYPFSFHTIKGTHLFPLEQPKKTAELIETVILTLSN